MHDDQHGTAIVVLAAALRNAAWSRDRSLPALRVVVSGAGAAGVACTRMLWPAGVTDIVVVDSHGHPPPGQDGLTNPFKQSWRSTTNPRGSPGTLAEA